ncbi:copper-binding protein [Variovorax terrae]|uniref:Copper-binding protein n=1 Tax=Variovorax terrae TaxID=2923278 RepID=A0A9X1VSN2_9BURK|nr:copper-binding protein [Variovorax terrae]MCJ0762339.1 copper-binding protein [Variovorax terrae]
MNRFLIPLLLAASLLGTAAQAQAPAADPAGTTEMSRAEVRKVDRETARITLRHGEIKNLGMPPMTMVFRVTEPQLLDVAAAGDTVRFRADKIDGQFTVTHLEKAAP